jgi:hypothetical protein
MDRWISAETERKEADFRSILGLHMDICKVILGRGPNKPYLYADLHAGPGNLHWHGRSFDGSPLVFSGLAAEKGLRHQALFFDSDPVVAAQLSAALSWRQGDGSVEVFAEPCETGMARWLARAGIQPWRYGLIYADPIGKEIPVELLTKANAAMPRVDILSYVAATGYKRRGGPKLSEHIAAVGKKHVLVREHAGPWQWTFLLFTNWDAYPDWKRIGFHRADSAAGRRILEHLDLTRREIHATTNEPLPLWGRAS